MLPGNFPKCKHCTEIKFRRVDFDDKVNVLSSRMAWLNTLKAANKSALVQDGRRKIHYTLPDQREMVEEYDMKTGDLFVRKWRKRQLLGGEGDWDFEIGDNFHQPPSILKGDLMRESNSNPIMTRKDTKECFQWRIRNLPYPLSTYSVTVDDGPRCCVIKTSNKKYYKKFTIPDLDRAELPLDQEAVSLAHANNTLIVSYKKPAVIHQMEKEIRSELLKLKTAKEGDVECNPS